MAVALALAVSGAGPASSSQAGAIGRKDERTHLRARERGDVHSARYAAALRTTVATSAGAYGYTLTIWTSGAVLSHARGIPSSVEALLFLIGAVVAYVLVGRFAFRGSHGSCLLSELFPPSGAAFISSRLLSRLAPRPSSRTSSTTTRHGSSVAFSPQRSISSGQRSNSQSLGCRDLRCIRNARPRPRHRYARLTIRVPVRSDRQPASCGDARRFPRSTAARRRSACT